MSRKTYFLRGISIAVPLLLLAVQPAGAQTSDSDRIKKLEQQLAGSSAAKLPAAAN